MFTNPGSKANDIAAALGIPANAVRTNLGNQRKRGLMFFAGERDKDWFLSPEGSKIAQNLDSKLAQTPAQTFAQSDPQSNDIGDADGDEMDLAQTPAQTFAQSDPLSNDIGDADGDEMDLAQTPAQTFAQPLAQTLAQPTFIPDAVRKGLAFCIKTTCKAYKGTWRRFPDSPSKLLVEIVEAFLQEDDK